MRSLLLVAVAFLACTPPAVAPAPPRPSKKPVRCSVIFEPFPFPPVAANSHATVDLFFRTNQICNEQLVLPATQTLTLTTPTGEPVAATTVWDVRQAGAYVELAQAARVQFDVPDVAWLKVVVRFEPGFGAIEGRIHVDRPPVAAPITWELDSTTCSRWVDIGRGERLCAVDGERETTTTWVAPAGSFSRPGKAVVTSRSVAFLEATATIVDRSTRELLVVPLAGPTAAATALGDEIVVALQTTPPRLQRLHADGMVEELGTLASPPTALASDDSVLLIATDAGVERRERSRLTSPGDVMTLANVRAIPGAGRLWVWTPERLVAVFGDGGIVPVASPDAGAERLPIAPWEPAPGRPLHVYDWFSDGRFYGWLPIDLPDGGLSSLVVSAKQPGALTGATDTRVWCAAPEVVPNIGTVTRRYSAKVPP